MAQIAEIIKYEGDNSTFIWKHPSEDFNSMTQLIVHESQEAIFLLNGQALDLFGPGRYTLETQNVPKIGKFLNRATGGETPFHCEVYFINKTVQMALKWGTDSKARYIDPESGLPLELGASGQHESHGGRFAKAPRKARWHHAGHRVGHRYLRLYKIAPELLPPADLDGGKVQPDRCHQGAEL